MMENPWIMKKVEAILNRFLRMVQNPQLYLIGCFYTNRYSYAYVMQYDFLNTRRRWRQ